MRAASLTGGIASIVAVAMSFLPWLDVKTQSFVGSQTALRIRGDDLESVTDFGDGIVTGVAAAASAIAALVLAWFPSLRRWLGCVLLASGLLVASLGLYAIFNDRDYVFGATPPFDVDFVPTGWLYIMTASSIVILASGLYLVASKSMQQFENHEPEEQATERAEGWA